jgi:hypothetical protein
MEIVEQNDPLFLWSIRRKPKGNRCGRIIYGLDGKRISQFAWGLGCTSNNQSKVLTIYMGIKLIKQTNTWA